MKSSTFSLSLTLFLALQFIFASAQDSILGKWTDPAVNNNFNPACCAPNTLNIQATTSPNVLLATYQYDDDHKLGFTDHCYELFGKVSPATITLVFKTGTDGVYEAHVTYGADAKTVTFNYEIMSVGTVLTIYTPLANNFGDACEITMFSPLRSGISKTLKFVLFGAVVLLILALVWRWYRRRQIVAKEGNVSMNSALNPTEQNNA